MIDFVNTRFQMAHFTIGHLSKGVKRIGTKGTRKIFSDAPLHCAPALICAAPSPFFSFALEWTWYRYVHQIPRVCVNTGFMDDNATGGVGLTWLHEVQQLIHSFYTAAKYSLIRVIWFGLELNGHPPRLISKIGPPSFMASPPFGRPTRLFLLVPMSSCAVAPSPWPSPPPHGYALRMYFLSPLTPRNQIPRLSDYHHHRHHHHHHHQHQH